MGGEAGFDCLPQGLIKNCLPVLPLRAAEAIHRRTETLSPLHQDHFFAFLLLRNLSKRCVSLACVGHVEQARASGCLTYLNPVSKIAWPCFCFVLLLFLVLPYFIVTESDNLWCPME